MTKKQRQMYINVKNCAGKTLFDFYKRPSQAKLTAYNRCFYEYYHTPNSYNFGVCCANFSIFTCGFLYDLEGVIHCRYYSVYNTYDFIVD